MRVALLTSANGWRGSGSSYAKLARGLGERGHVGPPGDRGAPAHRPPRRRWTCRSPRFRAATPARARYGRCSGSCARSRADAVVVDTPRDVRLAAYATLVAPGAHRLPLQPQLPPAPQRSHGPRLPPAGHGVRLSVALHPGRRDRPCALDGGDPRLPHPQRLRSRALRAVARGGPRLPRALRHRGRDAAVVVLTTAKLTRNKGHEVAITALGRLHASASPLVYLVCGDGGREEELRDLARVGRGCPRCSPACWSPPRWSARSPRRTWWCIRRSTRSSPMRSARRWRAARPVVAADAGGTARAARPRRGHRGAGAAGRCRRAGGRGARAARRSRARVAVSARPPGAGSRPSFPLGRMIDRYEAALLAVIE